MSCQQNGIDLNLSPPNVYATSQNSLCTRIGPISSSDADCVHLQHSHLIFSKRPVCRLPCKQDGKSLFSDQSYEVKGSQGPIHQSGLCVEEPICSTAFVVGQDSCFFAVSRHCTIMYYLLKTIPKKYFFKYSSNSYYRPDCLVLFICILVNHRIQKGSRRCCGPDRAY